MLLRLILVGLVTSLSLELPNSRDVSSWAETGRAWANANIVAVGSPEVAVVAPAEAAVASPAPDTVDREFQDVVGAMAAGFSADAPARADEAQVAATPEVPTAPAVEVVADDAVALPDGEELAAIAASEAAGEPACESDAVVAEAAEVEAEGDDASSRADRLADAVRLTREAAEAWAAVIAEPTR